MAICFHICLTEQWKWNKQARDQYNSCMHTSSQHQYWMRTLFYSVTPRREKERKRERGGTEGGKERQGEGEGEREREGER